MLKTLGDYTGLYVHVKLKDALEKANIPFLAFHQITDTATSEDLLKG
jgi:hypothetical protein